MLRPHVDQPSVHQLSFHDGYVVFRCVGCECINVAWEGSEKFKEIVHYGQLVLNIPCCQNNSCSCHRSGHKLQAKRITVGKDAPF
jgi:hypothetical protein